MVPKCVNIPQASKRVCESDMKICFVNTRGHKVNTVSVFFFQNCLFLSQVTETVLRWAVKLQLSAVVA
jgi:hypothetical protein